MKLFASAWLALFSLLVNDGSLQELLSSSYLAIDRPLMNIDVLFVITPHHLRKLIL